MKPISFYAQQSKSKKAVLAKAALNLSDNEKQLHAQKVLNKSAFSGPDVLFWHELLKEQECA